MLSLKISISRPTKTVMAGVITRRFQMVMNAQKNMELVQTIQSRAALMQIAIHGQMKMTRSLTTHSSGKILI